MGNLFRSGSGLFIEDIAKIGWLRSLLWCWEDGRINEQSIAERLPVGQAA
jgi:hypothetical protein